MERIPVRFSVYELDSHAGELRKHGIKVRLQNKPLRILELLLERPGEVVTRDQLRETLWPPNVYVDFDHSLNSAVNKLREALEIPPHNRGSSRRCHEDTVSSHRSRSPPSTSRPPSSSPLRRPTRTSSGNKQETACRSGDELGGWPVLWWERWGWWLLADS